MKKRNLTEFVFTAILLVFTLAVIFASVKATPTGVVQDFSSTDTGPSRSALNLTNDGGTITTLRLNVSQQDSAWKAYVGNVTGKLVLQDSSNYTIYDWNLATITGEVYASRATSVTWSNLNCSNSTILSNEYTAVNMVDSDPDSINKTFNETTHKSFLVGAISISNSTCKSLATFNATSSRQTISETMLFQEVLLTDFTSMVYATILEPNKVGYNNKTFDFQMIVPDSDLANTNTSYYFWAELG